MLQLWWITFRMQAEMSMAFNIFNHWQQLPIFGNCSKRRLFLRHIRSLYPVRFLGINLIFVRFPINKTFFFLSLALSVFHFLSLTFSFALCLSLSLVFTNFILPRKFGQLILSSNNFNSIRNNANIFCRAFVLLHWNCCLNRTLTTFWCEKFYEANLTKFPK